LEADEGMQGTIGGEVQKLVAVNPGLRELFGVVE